MICANAGIFSLCALLLISGKRQPYKANNNGKEKQTLSYDELIKVGLGCCLVVMSGLAEDLLNGLPVC
jgi:hypothetical protein